MKILAFIFEYFYSIVAVICLLLLAGLVIGYIHTSIAIVKASKEQILTDNEQKTNS